MDLGAELRSARYEVKESTDNKLSVCFEDLLTREAHRKFQKALDECCSCLGPSTPCYSSIFADMVTLTAFASGVRSPLSRFVGAHRKKLVIVSSPTSKEHAVWPSIAGPAQDSHTQEMETPFTVHSWQQVATSHTSRQQQHFLHTEQPLLPSSSSSPSTWTAVVDLGSQPVPMDTARYITSLYSQAFFADRHVDLPDLWVLCNGGSRGIVAMGCAIEDVGSAKQCTQRCLRSYTVLEGKTISVPAGRMKLDAIAPPRRGSRKGTVDMKDWWAYSEYDIGPSMEGEALSEHAQLLLQFLWSGVDSCISPPPNTAEAVLCLSVKPGYHFSPVLSTHAEVSTLYQLGCIAAGLSHWPETDEESVNSTTYSPLTLESKVSSFLEDASTQMLRAVESSVISPTAALSPFQPREDLDFLGQLWMFARHAASADDLVNALGLIFQAVLLGRVQPFIHHSKKSGLASLFRMAVSCSSHDQQQVVATKLQSLLTPERALDCLVEIGIEKMERDYFADFTSNSLAASTQLEPFFFKEGVGLLEQCGALCQLHCVLEVVAAAMTFLDLPQQSLSLLTKKALEYFQPSKNFEGFSVTPVFLLPFSTTSPGLKSLAEYASSLKPSVWSLTGGGGEGLNEKQRVAVCMTEPLFKYMRMASTDTEDTVMCVYHAESTCSLLQN